MYGADLVMFSKSIASRKNGGEVVIHAKGSEPGGLKNHL
jgi:hypothetical protein